MKKLSASILALLLLLSLITGCSKKEDDSIKITQDLTYEILEQVLTEKGDDLLLTDFPENIFMIPTAVAGVPHMIYPINEEDSFTVLPGPDGKNLFYLTSAPKEGEEKQFSGADEILAYIKTK